jgi:drug/metabolite transporter (DMT)-like permease
VSPSARRPAATPGPVGPEVVGRPPVGDLALMTVGVLAVSTSGPLIAATAAPALAIAFWRNGFGVLALAPVVLARHLPELRALTRREWGLTLAAGTLLAGHFATWVPSITLTTVASATALTSAQPVWAALMARVGGHRVPRRAWLGMAVALAGVLVLTGVDVTVSPEALLGDLLAIAGGAFAAGYMVAGGTVRRSVTTTAYTFVCYGWCAVLLAGTCLVAGADLGGYEADTWVKVVALTAGAQLLGHSVFNRVLKTTSPTVASLALLFETPGAAVLAALWLGQVPPLAALPAAALLLVGVAVVITARTPDAAPAVPAE